MTNNQLTRERLQEIAEDGFLKHGESKELAHMALATMESGPERNPVLSYADSYRDMAKQGVESVPIWSVITDLERNIAPLYRHAQPAPERDQVRIAHAEWSQATFGNVGPVGPLKHLSKEALEAAEQPGDLSEWADMQFLLWDAQRRAGITDDQITQAMIDKLAVNKQREWPEPKDGEPRLHIKEQPAPVVGSEPEAWLWSRGGDDERDVSLTPPDDDDDAADAIECGWTATPLYRHAQQPVVPEEKPMPNTLSMYAVDAVAAIAEVKGWNACRAAMLNHPSSIQPNTDAAPGTEIKHPSSNSPVIPDGSTAGMFNSARALLDALYEFGPDEIAISEHVTNLEDALQNAAAPQSLGSEPATVPGKWIPVSERMPENDVSVLTFDGMYKRVHHAMYGHWQCWEPEKITHWMPLPAAPQEVKSES